MNERAMMRRRIGELGFAVYELSLFLDTHPNNTRALDLLAEFRDRKAEAIADYESQFGKLIVTSDDVLSPDHWAWIDSPWPWENNFMED